MQLRDYERRPGADVSLMPLPPGTRLGPYELVELRGKGGMGEVYRARDTRLGREVAVKVLPEELSRDATFRQRFEREARTRTEVEYNRDAFPAFLPGKSAFARDAQESLP